MGMIRDQCKGAGALHLSELTSQAILVVMRISFLTKAIQPDQSNPTCSKEIVFHHQEFFKKAYFIFKMTGPAMVRPVLTFGKRR